MYTSLKRWLKALLPRPLLFAAEPVLRRGLYPLYRGRRYHCPVCGRGLRTFVALPTGELLCPACGSLPRTRRLWLLLAELCRPGAVVLDFSPARSLYRALHLRPDIDYRSTDLSGDFLADHRYDITAIDAADAAFDVILCYHILEHIPDDAAAMRELHRVLKPGGTCLVQTPFLPGTAIYEDATITTEEARLAHFGQADHVRVYSVPGLQQRLAAAGFEVEVRRFAELPHHRQGLQPTEVVLVCTR